MPPTILLTGAHGAIGSYTARELAHRGLRTIRLDVEPRPVTPFPELATQELEILDVCDTARLAQVIGDHSVTHVLHLAALIGEHADVDPARAIEVNGLASARLMDAASSAGVIRLLSNSTKGVLGPLDARHLHPHYEPVPVSTPPRPATPYEASKHLVEVAIGVHRARGASMAAVRLGTTWGPGKSSASHGGFALHSDIVAAALRGESSAVTIHPDQGHDLVYYADIAAGLVDLLFTEKPLVEPVYHLGSGRATRLGDFAAAVESAFPGVRVTMGTRFPGGRSCVMDIGPTVRDAGYAPAWDVPRALAEIKDLAAAGAVA